MSSVLNDLRKLTVISKKLSEAHFKTLSSFCFVALENVDKVEIEYCIDPKTYPDSSTPNGYVKYVIYKKNNKKGLGSKLRSQSERLEDIKRWTESIFWKDISVSFVNKKGKDINVKQSARNKKISS